MTRHTTTVSTDVLEATLSADMSRADYGVRGSPVWYEPTNVTVDYVAVLGVTIPSPPSALCDAIKEIAEWEC